MSASLARLAEVVQEATGIRIEERQHPALLAALRRARPDADPASFLRLIQDPVAGESALAQFVDEVTVKETFFLRDRWQLDSIEWRALCRTGKTIRVWCAACATGEEAYSLALLASEEFAPKEPPVRILATDISRAAIAAAEVGVYRGRAVRAVEPRLLERYFEPSGNRVAVAAALRRLVVFATHNLIRDPIPPRGEALFDVVICRNVFIYFDSKTTEELAGRLAQAVAPGGTLVLGAADALAGVTSRLARLADPSEPSRSAPPAPRRDRLGETLRAADAGLRSEALGGAQRLTAADPLNAELHFLRGLVELDEDPSTAVWSLRRALYLDPGFGLAAFTLGRAYEALGDTEAASRAYVRALSSLDPDDERYVHMHDQVDVADVAAACHARLRALREAR